MKGIAPCAQNKLVKHTVDHLLERRWSQLAGANEQLQGVSSPLRSSAPETVGMTTDCLSLSQRPQHLFSHLTGNLIDTHRCERKAGQAHCHFAGMWCREKPELKSFPVFSKQQGSTLV